MDNANTLRLNGGKTELLIMGNDLKQLTQLIINNNGHMIASSEKVNNISLSSMIMVMFVYSHVTELVYIQKKKSVAFGAIEMKV